MPREIPFLRQFSIHCSLKIDNSLLYPIYRNSLNNYQSTLLRWTSQLLRNGWFDEKKMLESQRCWDISCFYISKLKILREVLHSKSELNELPVQPSSRRKNKKPEFWKLRGAQTKFSLYCSGSGQQIRSRGNQRRPAVYFQLHLAQRTTKLRQANHPAQILQTNWYLVKNSYDL